MISRRWQFAWLVLAPAVASAAHAQSSPIDKGSAIISGSAALSRSHDSDTDRNATFITLQPTGFLFVKNHLAIGAGVNLGYASSEVSQTTSYGLGPAVRYYFGDLAGKTFPFVSASVFPIWSKATFDEPPVPGAPTPDDLDSRSLIIDGAFGLTHLVADHVGISAEAFYAHSKSTTEFGSAETTNTGYNVGLRFGITAFVR